VDLARRHLSHFSHPSHAETGPREGRARNRIGLAGSLSHCIKLPSLTCLETFSHTPRTAVLRLNPIKASRTSNCDRTSTDSLLLSSPTFYTPHTTHETPHTKTSSVFTCATMAEYTKITPTEAASGDMSNIIRETMSVSNMLTPPTSHVHLPSPTTPVKTAPSAAGQATPKKTKVAVDTKNVPASPDSVGELAVKSTNSESSAEAETTVEIKEASTSPASGGDDAGHGENVESSPIAPATELANVRREFVCQHDDHLECNTGQHTLDLSRKVISDHFGRNKACTRVIKDWPLFCRKHYQRATYGKHQWQTRKIALILRQLPIIEEQFPGTHYTVAFKKSEDDRLNVYSRLIASGADEQTAQNAIQPRNGKHFEAPIDCLRELNSYLGADKTMTEVAQIVTNINNMLEQKETEQVPSIEFLPQLLEDGTTWTETAGGSPRKGKAKAKSPVKKGPAKRARDDDEDDEDVKPTPKKAKAKAKA
jgi:hypothetical protein